MNEVGGSIKFSMAKVVNKVSLAENSVKCALQVLVLVVILLATCQSSGDGLRPYAVFLAHLRVCLSHRPGEECIFPHLCVVLLAATVVYAVFVLSFGDLLAEDYILSLMDQAFISVFLLEILMRIFALSYVFFLDPFNIFDTTIVVLSFCSSSWECRLGASCVRLMRLLVVFR